MTNTTKTSIDTFDFSPAALANIEETGCDPHGDLAALVCGDHTPQSLLAHCLDGADEDRSEGWRDYVSALECRLF